MFMLTSSALLWWQSSRLGYQGHCPTSWRRSLTLKYCSVVKALPRKAAYIFLMTTVFSAGAVWAQSLGWNLINWKIGHEFPDVPRISPRELNEWLQNADRPQPILLDVRTPAEYQVSHLHAAKRVEPGATVPSLRLPKDRPIVTYCAVGYRSAALADKLKKAGYRDVCNLEGSIFAWANDNYPVERGGHRVFEVHPYNELWGRLLKASLRARVPPAGTGM